MSSKKASGLFFRILFFALGQFFAAAGVVLCVKSNLGVSAGSALPNVVNKIIIQAGGAKFLLWDFSKLGDCTTFFFIGLVIFQIICLKKDFGIRNFLQLFGSVVFGVFVNMASAVFSWVSPVSYGERLLVLACGFMIQAVGIAIYIDTKLMLMPPEGVVVAIHKTFKQTMGRSKIIEDVALVVIALILSLTVLHRVEGIREGTVILALCVGPVMGKIHDFVEKPLKKLFYPEGLPKDMK